MTDFLRHLPPAAADRLSRAAHGRVKGSLLSAPSAVSLASVGLEPAGEVMGCIVMHLGWSGLGCGAWSGRYSSLGVFRAARQSPVLASTGEDGWQGFGPYVRARYQAYDAALDRLLAEAGALGADGVVGVRLTWSRIDSGARELIALGTAVRHRDPARRRPRDAWPWATELNGEQVASALLNGWQPLGIAIGLCLAVKHDDWLTSSQSSTFQLGSGNVEVTGLTQLLHEARSQARHKLTARAATFRGAAQVVVSSMDLEVGEQACGKDERDHLAEATFVGAVLARGSRIGPPVRSLSVLPLRGQRR